MFGGDRNQSPGIRPLLRVIQGGKCFYGKRMIAWSDELDHFIPWSLYPNDLAHNFVLARRRCNSDRRAPVEALDRLVKRNITHGNRFAMPASVIGLPAHAEVSARVTAWAYERSEQVARFTSVFHLPLHLEAKLM